MSRICSESARNFLESAQNFHRICTKLLRVCSKLLETAQNCCRLLESAQKLLWLTSAPANCAPWPVLSSNLSLWSSGPLGLAPGPTFPTKGSAHPMPRACNYGPLPWVNNNSNKGNKEECLGS